MDGWPRNAALRDVEPRPKWSSQSKFLRGFGEFNDLFDLEISTLRVPLVKHGGGSQTSSATLMLSLVVVCLATVVVIMAALLACAALK